jgi:outer membrane protein OmpA-like peptidoglycan-associated protein
MAVTNKPKADRDLDGVPDANDFCPDIAGLATQNGCPDADGDGVIDLRDKCPEQHGSTALDGCPDGDNDSVVDKDDKCPTTPGDPLLNGCPDGDRDGVADRDDDCPTEKGVATARGCPDRDNDGVPDKDDACPEISGLPAFKGCLDTDGDGIYDNEDRCPEVAGIIAAKGCPEIKTEDKEKLKNAVKLVQFKTGGAKLLSQSYAVLDEVAYLMQKYPAYNLSISGHTDNSGNDKLNQSLSEQRAYTCYLYLMRKDVSLSRMSHAGFGESNPVTDNSTAAGRAQNRRVEFDLYVK